MMEESFVCVIIVFDGVVGLGLLLMELVNNFGNDFIKNSSFFGKVPFLLFKHFTLDLIK